MHFIQKIPFEENTHKRSLAEQNIQKNKDFCEAKAEETSIQCYTIKIYI